jgi:hypothetical protein
MSTSTNRPVGLPSGGSTNQVLTKLSSTNYDVGWATALTGVAWGDITGTLSNQTDLQAALNAKAPLTNLSDIFLTADNGAGKSSYVDININGLDISNSQVSGNSAEILLDGGTNPSFDMLAVRGLITAEHNLEVTTGDVAQSTLYANTKFAASSYTGSGTAELTYGKTAHIFSSTAPSGSVKINKSKSGDFLYIQNNTASTITFIQNTSETFNGATTYDLTTNQTAIFYQINGNGIFAVETLGISDARTAISATAPVSYNSSTGVISMAAASGSVNGYLSSTDWTTFNNKQAAGNYITALTGNVVASGPGSVAATIQANVVTNAMLSTVATATFKGRTTAGTGNVEDLTATQATALLNAMVGDSGSGGTKGLVPAPASGDSAKFLTGAGTYVSAASLSSLYAFISTNTTLDSTYNGKIIVMDDSGGVKTITGPASPADGFNITMYQQSASVNTAGVFDGNGKTVVWANNDSLTNIATRGSGDAFKITYSSTLGYYIVIWQKFNGFLNVATTNLTLNSSTRDIIGDTTSGALTMTLEPVAPVTGRERVFINTGTTNNMTIDGNASEPIVDSSGASNLTYIVRPLQRVKIKANTSSWNVVDEAPWRYDNANNRIGYAVAPAMKLHVDVGDSAADGILLTQGTTTGTSSTDGFKMWYPTAGNASFVMDYREIASGTFSLKAAGANVLTFNSTVLTMLDPTGTNFVKIDGTGVGVMTASIAGRLSIGAGSASANTAPIKLNSGTIMTTAEAGAVEYDGTLALTKASAIRYRPGGTLKEFFTDVGNVGTGEDDLYSYTIPASTLDTNGHQITARYGGIFVNSVSTKQVKVYFGGTMVFDSGALTITATSAWTLDVFCIRVSSSVVRCSVSMNSSGASLAGEASYTEVTGLTLTNTQVLKLTGETAGASTADNDIVAKVGAIRFQPNN